MKKIVIIFIVSSILFISKSFSQDTTATIGWPSSERTGFINECVKSAKTGLSEDSSKSYCYCMLEKMETKYPNVDDAAKVTDADLASPEWQAEMDKCLSSGSLWTPKDYSAFLSECTGAAKESMGEVKSKSYCECMMFKLESKYPNPVDAGAITDEALQSPEWQKEIKRCLGF